MKKTWEAFKRWFGLTAYEKRAQAEKDWVAEELAAECAKAEKRQRDITVAGLAGQFVIAQALRGIHPMEDGNWMQAVVAAERMMDFIETAPEQPVDHAEP